VSGTRYRRYVGRNFSSANHVRTPELKFGPTYRTPELKFGPTYRSPELKFGPTYHQSFFVSTICFCRRSNPGAKASSISSFWLTACHDAVPSEGLALRARPT
jgi:hypothetical protein